MELSDQRSRDMNGAVKDLLESGEIPEDALVAAAEQLFLDLDARESGNGQF